MSESEQNNLKSAHILVVDDEEEIRKMLSRHFRFLGYTVFTADNGVSALELLEMERVEVVITDVMMPKMDGVELLKNLREDYPMIKSIVITGYVTMHNLLSAIGFGAETCIFKPLQDLKELDDAVDRSISVLNNWQKKLRELKALKMSEEV